MTYRCSQSGWTLPLNRTRVIPTHSRSTTCMDRRYAKETANKNTAQSCMLTKSSTLNMGAVRYPETSVNFYQTIQCHIPKTVLFIVNALINLRC
jgi:hypothetical protein